MTCHWFRNLEHFCPVFGFLAHRAVSPGTLGPSGPVPLSPPVRRPRAGSHTPALRRPTSQRRATLAPLTTFYESLRNRTGQRGKKSSLSRINSADCLKEKIGTLWNPLVLFHKHVSLIRYLMHGASPPLLQRYITWKPRTSSGPLPRET